MKAISEQSGQREELARRAAWLRRYQDSLRAERLLRDRILRTRARLEATTRALSPAPAGGGPDGPDRLGAGLGVLEEYQARLEAQLGQSEAIRAEIEAALEALEVPLQRAVLEARYLDGLPAWKTADKLYISESWVKKLHRAGLECLYIPPEEPQKTSLTLVGAPGALSGSDPPVC